MVNKALHLRIVVFLSLLWLIKPINAAEPLTLAVASNFNLAMQHLVTEYEAMHKTPLQVSFASSGKLYAQIVNGAPFDIFLSADQTKPQALIDRQLAVASSRFTYAYGSLALWSAKPELVDSQGQVLHSNTYIKLAFANPKLAPYGVAAMDVLAQLGLLVATQQRWVQGENISQTYQFVATQNADLGFVALSQIMYKGQLSSGSAWVVPTTLYAPIKQDALILNRSAHKAIASEFMAFLQSPEALAILQNFGYQQGAEQ
tara:strand:+ start:15201 stop:15977 length:777 start_codon:yes stop_codon:yes gene_type:complete